MAIINHQRSGALRCCDHKNGKRTHDVVPATRNLLPVLEKETRIFTRVHCGFKGRLRRFLLYGTYSSYANGYTLFYYDHKMIMN
jgi:hypothetical protein